MDYVQIYYYNLYSTLLATCPRDTGNMISHIRMEEHPDYMLVRISAPKLTKKLGNYDYAKAVNEGLAAAFQNRPMSPKEEKNYHWVQRAVTQAAQLTTESVKYQGGYNIGI